jgi:hypothetical protein
VAKPEDKPDPSTTSAAYNEMIPKWNMLRTLLGGTTAMRLAGRTYLPQHPHESTENYNDRLSTAVLLNMTEITLDSLVGKPFSDPITLNPDVPDTIKEFTTDIDLQGNNLHEFARHWFREGVGMGIAHALIDFPQIAPVDGRERTLLDDQQEQVRPYWILIKAENVIFMSTVTVRGREVLDHVRIMEIVTDRVGFAEVQKVHIKILESGSWAIYEQRKIPRSQKVVWVKINEGTTRLDFIPLVTFYANKDSVMVAKPPLEDLAYMNVRHWQSNSDQQNILTVARFPMLAVSGAHDTPDKNVMAIGPRQLLATRAENGKYYYVEHSGKAIESGAKDLEKLEQDMAAYGAEFLRKRPGGQTGTARALDSAEATSPLQDMTLRFIDSVNTALDMTAAWIGEKEGGTVLITTDFGPDETSDYDIRGLLEARRNRDLSREGFLNEFKRRGMLAENFEAVADLKLLQDEPTINSPFATGRNNDGSGMDNIANKTKKAQAGKSQLSGGSS